MFKTKEPVCLEDALGLPRRSFAKFIKSRDVAERCVEDGISSVCASTQYNMGFILACGPKHNNRIVFRDDNLSHEERWEMAKEINAIINQLKP